MIIKKLNYKIDFTANLSDYERDTLFYRSDYIFKFNKKINILNIIELEFDGNYNFIKDENYNIIKEENNNLYIFNVQKMETKGIEPMTSRMQSECSTPELCPLLKSGDKWSRTSDLSLAKRALYR